ncbi:S8 family serine peptidase [Dactylosporangium salmoneum]|uniref:Type VII secretion-associated serine protease mycosin n=1 Tax=Dactylosporangium salmoneum TaxID=53361 RepID=A0ABP5V957_9ACTN
MRIRGSARSLIAAVLVAAVLLTGAPAAAADTVRQQEWWLDALQVVKAQQLAKGDGVVVAVVDTGVDSGQPDLAGALLPGAGTNGVRSDKGWEDPDGHGTQMATVLAGRGGDGGLHMLGIAPHAKILPVAIPIGERSAAGGSTRGDLAEPVRYAADHGAKIINLSFALADDTPKADEQAAIAYARQKGAVLVAAGGNRPQGNDHVPLPARYPGVLTVSGTNRDGSAWEGSIADPKVDIAAPAQDIIGAAPKARYPSGFAVGSGTSGSAAIVSGVLALVWSKYPQLDADAVVDRVLRTAQDKGPPGRDDQFGAGLVDPYAALTAPLSEPTGEAGLAPAPGPPASAGPPVLPGPPVRRVVLVGAGALLVALVLFLGVARPLLRASRRR